MTIAAGDRADARGLEGLAHLGGADRLLDLLRLEQALHRGAQLLDDLVDDAVGADLDALALGHLPARRRTGRTLKPMMTASEAAASITSDSVMPPTPSRITRTVTCSCGSFAISSASASSEPATSALMTRLSSASSPSLCALEDVLERHLHALAARERLGLEAVGALAGQLARLALVLHHADVLAGLGHAVEAEHLDRHARACACLTRSPRKSCIARTRPQCAPATSASPTFSVPRLISSVTTGPRPGSSRDSITVPDASASGLALQLLQLGTA